MEYNYYKEMEKDIIDYIEENVNLSDFESEDEFREKMYDELFISDSVTGNASGSYFFSRYKAEQAICHNIDLYFQSCEEFGTPKRQDAETIDVCIRCYLLPEVLNKVIDKMNLSFGE